jgi:adenosylhomocysteine nucleosidase
VWQVLVQNWLRNRAMNAAMGAARDASEKNAAAANLPVNVVVVAALEMELGGLLDRLGGVVTTQGAGFKAHRGAWRDRGVLLVESGMGRERAARAAEAVIHAHQPAWVISTGFAGGLAPELARLHLVVGNSVSNSDGQRLAIDVKLVADPRRGLHVGRHVTVDRIVRTTAEKRALAEKSGAIAVDMETFAVAEACRAAKTKFMAVRIISDSVDDELPADLERLVQRPSMAGKLGAAAGAIVRRPGSVKDLWNLREQALLATDRLATFLLGMIEQLPADTRPSE